MRLPRSSTAGNNAINDSRGRGEWRIPTLDQQHMLKTRLAEGNGHASRHRGVCALAQYTEGPSSDDRLAQGSLIKFGTAAHASGGKPSQLRPASLHHSGRQQTASEEARVPKRGKMRLDARGKNAAHKTGQTVGQQTVSICEEPHSDERKSAGRRKTDIAQGHWRQQRREGNQPVCVPSSG